MIKLLIMIDAPQDVALFEQNWLEFLHRAETKHGLHRERTSRGSSVLLGESPIGTIHALFFDYLEDLKVALASPQSQAARKNLQRITERPISLLLAQQIEDNLDCVQAYKG